MREQPQVVVIEDDEAVLDSLQALLAAEGLNALPFNSARAFLEAHERGPPACLVTDVRMPDMDGLELLATLKRRGPLPPVIVITGHGDVPMAVRAMKLGARDFIEKPFDPGVLLAGIREALAATPERLLLGRKSAAEKVATFLVTFAHRLGHGSSGPIALRLPMTRHDMADYLGLTIETVSRTLTRLRQEGVITFASQDVILQRPLELEALACGPS